MKINKGRFICPWALRRRVYQGALLLGKVEIVRFICPWALRRGVYQGALLLGKVEIGEDNNEGSNRAFYETGG